MTYDIEDQLEALFPGVAVSGPSTGVISDESGDRRRGQGGPLPCRRPCRKRARRAAARSNDGSVAVTLPPIEGVRYLMADTCEVSSLKAAHFDEMDVVVATTGDDEDNLVISQLAKREFAVHACWRG